MKRGRFLVPVCLALAAGSASADEVMVRVGRLVDVD
jgi:hypothetical protein